MDQLKLLILMSHYNFIALRLSDIYSAYWFDSSSYWELLDKLQKQICRTTGPSNPWLISKCSQLKSFYKCHFGKCSYGLAQLVLLIYSKDRCTHYSDRLHNFLSPFLNVTRMSMSTVSFLAQLQMLNGFKSWINRQQFEL